jgi:FKBP-type peptidyl-prolyl cis-trans isomerase FkpA
MNSRPAAAAALIVILGSLGACSRAPAPASLPADPPKAAPMALQSKDLKSGEGAPIAAGQTAVVNYTGWLYEAAAPDNKGKKFDSSLDSGSPFSFQLGAGRVIAGWDQGVVGEDRRPTAPGHSGGSWLRVRRCGQRYSPWRDAGV